ncbi:MAG: ABC transporter permease [Micrococcales bacterium]|nr:MAG: ABC transporter permease [Micrococcales bacterium]PIE27125.1 MAG: ABC transporter permease [Micrococcales bacterium]
MTVAPTWNLALALILLVGLTVVVSALGELRIGRQTVWAAVRAVLQLVAVSAIVVAAVQHLLLAWAFILLVFVIGVLTTSRRTGVLDCWPWVALAMAAGVSPVLLIVFGTGTAPLTGIALIPIAGIVLGNVMTAHTLVARRSFATLKAGAGAYEAALALGLSRPQAIRLMDPDSAREATIPANDQTRTVGLVTLPGAYIGVLLGGGSPAQAAAAQVLVLVGVMAGQAITVAVAQLLIADARILPGWLRPLMHE